MTQFLANPWFWVSVILVAAVTHYVMNRFLGGAGGGG